MALLKKEAVAFTTDGSGDATVYSNAVNGFLQAVHYDYGDADTGADFTITDETTGIALLTITNGGTSDLVWYPHIGGHPVANTGAGTNSTVRLVPNPVVGRIKVVVASGGDTKTGTLNFFITR